MAKRGRKKQSAVAPPEAPEASPEQSQEEPKAPEENKKEAIVENDAPAGGGEVLKGGEEPAPLEPEPEKPVTEAVQGKRNPAEAIGKAIAYGLHDGYCVVDREEFAKLIKQLNYGTPFDPYGIMAMLQKMFQLKTWEEAKEATKTLLTKG